LVSNSQTIARSFAENACSLKVGFHAVDGDELAKGASIGDNAGPVVVDGMVYVSSGYAGPGGRPGNVLLAFGVD